ncbi:MAG: MAPEG family protein [Xanthobacteraceae bacterium]|nr:MAPEG family protein [Xanthobacteraceae bacterium]
MNPLHFPSITAATAVVLALLQTSLMLNVSLSRTKSSTGLGDGGDEGLLRRIRMHGNLAENAAMFLVLLGLTEMTGEWGLAIPVIAASFVLFRLAHPIGLSLTSGPSAPRIIGAVGTVIAFICTASLLAISVFGRMAIHG